MNLPELIVFRMQSRVYDRGRKDRKRPAEESPGFTGQGAG